MLLLSLSLARQSWAAPPPSSCVSLPCQRPPLPSSRPPLPSLSSPCSLLHRLSTLRGGARTTKDPSPVATSPKPEKSSLLFYASCAAIIVAWIGAATFIFARNEGWPLAQSLFYAVDTGMSIGFGAVAEEKISTKAFTVLHVLLGASAVGGAIALFAESVVEASPMLASDEYTRAALIAAFSRADTDGSGELSTKEMSRVLLSLGFRTRADEAADFIKCFDKNGDGSITIEEFIAAVAPQLQGGASVEEGVRRAVKRRSEPGWAKALRSLTTWVSENRAIVLWALWIVSGTVWWLAVEGGDVVTALYFAVGGLATGGLQAPTLTKQGTLPDKVAVFVALYCLSGIPIFAMALGKFAHLFVAKHLAANERRKLEQPISSDEYSFAQQLFDADGKVDLSEFMALELLRLGKAREDSVAVETCMSMAIQVDMAMLTTIKARFRQLDLDRNGKLSKREALTKVHR